LQVATTLVATCTPNALLGQSLLNTHQSQTSPSALTGMQALSPQREMLLGYPINMEIPPAEFFVWRRKLFDVGINQFGFKLKSRIGG